MMLKVPFYLKYMKLIRFARRILIHCAAHVLKELIWDSRSSLYFYILNMLKDVSKLQNAIWFFSDFSQINTLPGTKKVFVPY